MLMRLRLFSRDFKLRSSVCEITMSTIISEEMGQVSTTITVTNRVDQIRAERGFISANEIEGEQQATDVYELRKVYA